MTITIKPNNKFTQHHSLFQNLFLFLSHNKSVLGNNIKRWLQWRLVHWGALNNLA